MKIQFTKYFYKADNLLNIQFSYKHYIENNNPTSHQIKKFSLLKIKPHISLLICSNICHVKDKIQSKTSSIMKLYFIKNIYFYIHNIINQSP